MRWLRSIFRDGGEEREAQLRAVQEKFSSFLALLGKNNQVLKVIGDLEEKSQGEHLFDVNYIRQSARELREGVAGIVENMIALGGEAYHPLRERYAAIDTELEAIVEGRRPIQEDAYTIAFDELGRERATSVGSKNAQLGELRAKLGLPVPDGFAISAWAYKRFVDANDLQSRITAAIRSLDIKRYEDLVRVSESIRSLVSSSPVPQDLADSIRESYEQLVARSPAERFSLRSSAIGEDTSVSFAGQYSTFLGVKADELLDRYRDVVAGKFTPKAIYYFLSHELSESALAMSVGCVAMVDAAASGVVYTRDPVRPDEDHVLVSSIFGLGQYLVSGRLTPDCFRVARDGRVLESALAAKPVRLVLGREAGVFEEPVPPEEQASPSLTEPQLAVLAEHAARIESHYDCPQDIEWALDRSGQLYLLQTRPLRVVRSRPSAELPDLSGLETIRSGGVTVCPGAGYGPVHHVTSPADLANVPQGAVVVSTSPFPGLITVMGQARALVTEVGGVASHMATLAREFRLPTLTGVERASELQPRQPVTVDATGGSIFAGEHPELVAARRPEYELFEDTEVYGLLRDVLAKVAPLNLLHPGDQGFRAEACQTFHDITRFAHQKSMEEMFTGAKEAGETSRIGLRLKSTIPLEVRIIYVDQDLERQDGRGWVKEDEIASAPMAALWGGIRDEGWPAQARPVNLSGFVSVMTTQMGTGQRQDFSEASFALLSREYMILSLRLGYHFTTFESMCTDEPSKNYIRMQFKGGGASLDRRLRRIRLLMELLSRLGFEHSSKGDFIDSALVYQERGMILEKLRLLGRVTMLTKQLDMALSNDAITDWYVDDFARKLGLRDRQEIEA